MSFSNVPFIQHVCAQLLLKKWTGRFQIIIDTPGVEIHFKDCKADATIIEKGNGYECNAYPNPLIMTPIFHVIGNNLKVKFGLPIIIQCGGVENDCFIR